MVKVTFHAFLAFRPYSSHTGSAYHLFQVGIDEIPIDEVLDKGIKIVATSVVIDQMQGFTGSGLNGQGY